MRPAWPIHPNPATRFATATVVVNDHGQIVVIEDQLTTICP
jgi:hypothetical protein